MHTLKASKRVAALTLIWLFVLSAVPRAHAHHNSHHKSLDRSINVSTGRLPAACDFDADVKEDQVTLHSSGPEKTIEIRFGKARSSEVSFTASSNAPGALVAGDIDRDGDVDLVWVGAADRNSAVVLLNDGGGNFAEATDNSSYASGLDGLLGSDPSSDRKLKRGQTSLTLTSASFHQSALPFRGRFQSTTISLVPVSIGEPRTTHSLFLRYLRKRGPPEFLHQN